MALAGAFRGGLQVGNTLYGAWTDEIYTINQSGERELLDTLTGSDKIWIAQNNAATPNIAIVCDDGPKEISSGSIITYSDNDVGSPACLCSHLGYFIFGYGDGDLLASGLNSASIDTTDSARAESNPDGVKNVASYNGQLYVFGEKTIEVWGEPTNASGFPITRIGYNIRPGLKANFAVSGYEPEFGHDMVYVGSDSTVRRLMGYTPEKISPPDLDRLIAAVEFPDDDLDSLCYVVGGHSFWQLNGPTWTWVFNMNNNTWHERRSYGQTKSTLTRSVPAFDKWMVGDTSTTNLYRLDHDIDLEGSNPIVCEMQSLTVEAFPNRQICRRADFDFTVGEGEASGTDPIETDPSVYIEKSDDGGQSWGPGWVRKLGQEDKTQQRITVLNTGQCGPMGRRWRWTVSDPVHLGFVGADMHTKVVRE